jgi:hypothetical protein
MIPFTLQPAGLAHMFSGMPPEAVKAFSDDRAVFRANMPRMRPADATAAFSLYLDRLAQMLAKQDYFFGAAASIADFSIYHNLWFVLRGGPVAEILDVFPTLQAWRERMGALGHGTSDALDSGAAIAIARDSTAATPAGTSLDTHGIAIGERVTVAATDTGVDPIEGTLSAATADRISIMREDPRAGHVAVHFPRIGFEMRRVR